MVTIILFLVGVLSLLLFHPLLTGYQYNNPYLLWKFVTMFTHMISHANWDHLLGNYIFGAPFMLYLEHKLKSHKTFVRLFFALGFCALGTQILLDSLSVVHGIGLIGSSGAIFGVIAATLMLYKGPKLVEISAKLLLLFYLFTQLQMAIISLRLPLGIAYGAHLGGMLGGILFSLYHRRRHHQSPRIRGKKTRK